MANIFELTPDIIQIAQFATDDMISALGKVCRLVYEPVWTVCSDCTVDPVGNKPGTTWIDGAPIPFSNANICPVCNGEGYRAVESTEDISLIIADQPSYFLKLLPANIKYAEGMILTKGYLSDVPKILRAKEMIKQPDLISTTKTYRYKLASEPADWSNIVQGRYFIAFWTRAG